jgi:aminoglycoside 6'-N-acetyltransferase
MWNRRAARCYEKAGFRKVRILPKHELHECVWRDSWLMVVEAERNG